MVHTDKLFLKDKAIPFEQLLSEAGNTDRDDDLSPYEQNVLQFCRQWLQGQESFTINTSGSTGKPKAITITRKQMIASARMTGQALGLQAGDKALVCLSTEYIAGMMMLVRGFTLGLELTIVTPSSNPLTDFPADERFDFTALVPLQLQQILTDTPDKLPILNGMKAILVGGAPVSASLQAQLQRVRAPIYHTYGMTETVTHIALRRLNGPQASSAFTPLPGVEIGRDKRGCLAIEPVLSAVEVSVVTGGQRLRTNDLVDLNPDGSFVWRGRIDNTINSGGVKVQVETVEAALGRALLRVAGGRYAQRRFFVGPMEYLRLGQAVVAVIEGAAFSTVELREMKQLLQGSLDKYEVPRRFYFLPRLAETSSGKLDRISDLKHLRDNA